MSELFPERIETERLVLEALTTDAVDVLDLYEHVEEDAPHIDEITEYLTWAPHEHPKETLEFVERVTDEFEAGDTATYLIRPAEGEEDAGEFAGACALTVDWDRRTGELGTWLRKPFWGRGYSGERAGALIELAFERLELEVVATTVHVGNEKSRKAVARYMDAHGGREEGVLRNGCFGPEGEPVDAHRFSVTAEEYRAATR